MNIPAQRLNSRQAKREIDHDFSQTMANALARAILINLASTWTGSLILNPVLRTANDILDLAEVA